MWEVVLGAQENLSLHFRMNVAPNPVKLKSSFAQSSSFFADLEVHSEQI